MFAGAFGVRAMRAFLEVTDDIFSSDSSAIDISKSFCTHTAGPRLRGSTARMPYCTLIADSLGSFLILPNAAHMTSRMYAFGKVLLKVFLKHEPAFFHLPTLARFVSSE